MRFALWAGLMLWMLAAPPAFAATQMQDLENALMCKCDDNCGKVLINCTCDTSKKTRKELMAKLESGLTVDQIVQGYVAKYGETILSAPSKSGFNLTAWVMPFVALVAGGFGVRQIVRKWAGRQRPAAAEGNPDARPEAVQYSSRLKKELDELEY